jgi:hypothetical protein
MTSVKELNNVFDYKKAITTKFDNVLKRFQQDENSNIKTIDSGTKLIIFTQNVLIEGEINHFNKEEDEKYLFAEGLKELGSSLAELPERMNAVNLTGPLHLIEVTISPLGNPEQKHKLKEMILFTDQILGLTIK